jgi:hypothetical protein
MLHGLYHLRKEIFNGGACFFHRFLVNPEALEEAKERFLESQDYNIVLRVPTKQDFQKLADRTKSIRERRSMPHSRLCGRSSIDFPAEAEHDVRCARDQAEDSALHCTDQSEIDLGKSKGVLADLKEDESYEDLE